MPISVLHLKSLTQADGTGTSVVHPSDWNSAHSVSINLSSTEIIRAIKAGGSSVSVGNVSFVNSNGFSFGMDSAGNITALKTLSSTEIIRQVAAGGSNVSVGNVSFVNSNGFSFGMDSAGNIMLSGAVAPTTRTLSNPLPVSGLQPNLPVVANAALSGYCLLNPIFLTENIAISKGVLVPFNLNVVSAAGSASGAWGFDVALCSATGGTLGTITNMASSTFGCSYYRSLGSVTATIGGQSTSFTVTSGTSTVGFELTALALPGSFTLSKDNTYWVAFMNQGNGQAPNLRMSCIGVTSGNSSSQAPYMFGSGAVLSNLALNRFYVGNVVSETILVTNATSNPSLLTNVKYPILYLL